MRKRLARSRTRTRRSLRNNSRISRRRSSLSIEMSPVPKSVVLFPLDFLKLFNESPQNARLLSFGGNTAQIRECSLRAIRCRQCATLGKGNAHEGQNRGCSGSIELPIIVSRRSRRKIYLWKASDRQRKKREAKRKTGRWALWAAIRAPRVAQMAWKNECLRDSVCRSSRELHSNRLQYFKRNVTSSGTMTVTAFPCESCAGLNCH